MYEINLLKIKFVKNLKVSSKKLQLSLKFKYNISG